MLRQRRQEEASLEPAVAELSHLMSQITAELAVQHDAVEFVADAVAASRDNVQKGTRELEKVTSRPSFMKEFVVTFILIFTLLLLLLDWISP